MHESGIGLELVPEMKSVQTLGMSRAHMMVQRHNQLLELWEDDPQGQLPERQIAKNIYLNNRSEAFDVGDFWKRQVREQLLNLPPKESMTIGITSTGSGAGKGGIAEGLMYFAENDIYLHSEATKQGITVIPVVVQFAMYMKAAQVPAKRGGPGLINPGSGHGRFTEEEYAIGSAFGQSLIDEHAAKNANPNVRYLYLVEGSGVPWIKRKGRRPAVSDMPDRGASTVYNQPKSRKSSKYVLVVNRDNEVGDQTKKTRSDFDPDAQDYSHVFNNGKERYVLTNRQGELKDVGQMSYNIQRAVIELLRLATAPPAAIERSDKEFEEMKNRLRKGGQISDPSTESYLQALRERLVYSGGYEDGQVLFVSNPDRGSLGNDHYLDYLLRRNLVSQMFKNQLIPTRLRGTYMDLYPTSQFFR